MNLTYEQAAELRDLVNVYNAVGEFVTEHKTLTYIQFDYALSHGLTLFTIQPDFDFEMLENKINVIVKALPAIKRIFAQPCIHLKERDEILPTESVRIINNRTIRHISSHSELWSNIKDGEIVPAKLLTRTYNDNYGIYENLVFCQTVDDILSFVRTNTRFIQELIYTNRTIEINLLERVHHLNYFLALGKLHISYSRNFESYYPLSVRCLNKLQFLSNSIIPRLKRPVYKNNRVRPAQIKIRKTNILSMHKEYHQVYKLAKSFASNKENYAEVSDGDLLNLEKNYFDFCQALCVFAAGHFNFTCNESEKIDFAALNADFNFKGWRARLKRVKYGKTSAISLAVTKDSTYTALIVPTVSKDCEKVLQAVKEAAYADEYTVFTPYEDVQEEFDESTYIALTNVESFRRIQQLLLKAMIYSDGERDECPFCSNKLTLNEQKSTPQNPVYECSMCRTQVAYAVCPTNGSTYAYTRIAGLSKTVLDDSDRWLAKRKEEAQMYFRNITRLTKDMEIVCPVCNRIHKS